MTQTVCKECRTRLAIEPDGLCAPCTLDSDPGFLRWLESGAELDLERTGARYHTSPADFAHLLGELS